MLKVIAYKSMIGYVIMRRVLRQRASYRPVNNETGRHSLYNTDNEFDCSIFFNFVILGVCRFFFLLCMLYLVYCTRSC